MGKKNLKLVEPFSKLSIKNISEAGGKGASLGEMTQAGIPVPQGFVILSNCFEEFLATSELNIEIESILKNINPQDINSVEKASEEIKALVLNSDIPKDIEKRVGLNFKKLKAKYVAVRSSATSEDSTTAAWAGQLESYLNTTSKNLIENIKKCWASLFTPRAISYRFEKKLEKQKISVAVVVQKMVESEVSGIAFSVHPITQNENQMIIEAGYGLGEAIVSGQITPDSYVINKLNLKVIDKNVAEQSKALVKSIEGGVKWMDVQGETKNNQKLSASEINNLAKIILKIEKHYKFPCDIEWAREGKNFFILQSRPITTIEKLNKEKIPHKNLYKSANEIIKSYNIHPPFIHKGFHAYFYPIDFVQLMWNIWGKYEGYYYKLHISALHDDYWDIYYIPSEFTAMRNHYLRKLKNDKNYLKNHYKRWLVSCGLLDKRIRRLEIKLLTHKFKNILKTYEEFIESYLFEYALAAPIQEACGFQPEQWLNPEIESYCKKYSLDFQKISSLLASPINLSFVSAEELTLLKIALKVKNKKEPKLERTLKIHQKRWFWIRNNYAHIEYLPISFFEDRVKILSKSSKGKIKEEIKKLEISTKQAKEEKIKLFKNYKPSDNLKLFVEVVERFAEMQDVRKSFVLRANYYHKCFLEEVNKEYSQPIENLWYYTYKELLDVIKSKKFLPREEIEKRKKMIIEIESRNEKKVVSGEEAIYLYDALQEKFGGANTFGGLVAQPGIANGIVKVVFKAEDLNKVQEGDVMVSSMTRPEMTFAMKKASAFVTDEGGITSHAAIIAREMKKPCIIGTKNATKILKDGDLVEVNANAGIVTLIKRNSN